MGNIVAITDPIDGEKTYTYDPQGQMTQETIGDKTCTYTYDGVGNILSATKDGVAHTYTYGDDDWGDLLTAYDSNAITYDAIGNPLTYYNGQSWNFTWVNGRTLSQAVSGDTTVSYVYDKTNGMRLSKTVGDTTYEYYYGDSQLLRMTVSDGTVMDFFYDHNGLPYAVKYNGTNYYYILNQQGDVVRLISADGTTVGTYQYDAWGNILSVTNNDLTNANPLRYRGYVYDDETGFYYLTSRYYDPKIGRFINADSVVAGVEQFVQGYNLFAYCFSNPVNMDDSSGNWPKWAQKIANTVKSVLSNGIDKIKTVANKVKQDIKSFDIKNTSERKVLDSNYVSAYKGKLTFKTKDNRSGSFGALFISEATNNIANAEDVVRHEYGHSKQMEELGVVNYTLCILVPSYLELGSDSEYYRRPWEITADIYGGVQSRSYPGYETAGFEYLENSKKQGVFILLTID